MIPVFNVNGLGYHRFVITCDVFAASEEEAEAKVLAHLKPAIEGEGALSIRGLALQKEIRLPYKAPPKKRKPVLSKKADAREVSDADQA